MSLADYHAKRNFDRTPEPSGKAAPMHQAKQESGNQLAEPLRFVVQKHAASRLHYDFRLEMGGVLKSWAVPKGPSLNPHDRHLAIMTEDHPYDYRSFEGTIPAGNYGAGSVIVWDEGTYEPLAWDEKTGRTLQLSREEQDRLARAAVHAGHLTFILHGHKLSGEFALIKMHHAADQTDDHDNAWLLVKADKDQFVSTDNVALQAGSVITGRTVEEVAAGAPERRFPGLDLATTPKGAPPHDLKPMLATLATKPFDHADWLYEVKWDGYRILAHITPDHVRLQSRNGQDYTDRFQPAATELHAGLQASAVIDGEMCVVDADGKPSFQALQHYLQTGDTTAGHLLYYAFDLLYLDGHNLTSLPLVRRKQLLQHILPRGAHLKYSDHVVGEGTALLATARTRGLEGVMAKAAASPYRPGHRSRDWFKFKTHHRQEAVIVGYTQGRGSRQHFGALVLGLYDGDGHLVYAGHTGSGFTDASLEAIYKQLQPLRQDHSPITPEPDTNEPAQWVKPQLVCEVEFSEWTQDGSMRHPIFMGLRDDKPATAVQREAVVSPAPATTPATPATKQDTAMTTKPPHQPPAAAGDQPVLTHLDKVFWPHDHITKGRLLDYYRDVADLLLPYLADRPQSLNRFPNGIAGPSFYQKDVEDHPDWVKTTLIHSGSAGKDIHYVLCQDLPTLLYLINLGCIELNPWNSRTHHLDHPDWCVIDLDPEAISFDGVIQTAQTVHAVLDELNIPHYPKTSGASGLHVYIPTGAKYSYDQVKLFVELIVRLVHDRLPDLTSLERSPAKRQGKVYLDYLQNRHGQTLAAAYSVRPQPGATVSMPLDWTEVKAGLTPQRFTIHNAAGEAKTRDSQLWRPILGNGIDLPAILKQLSH